MPGPPAPTLVRDTPPAPTATRVRPAGEGADGSPRPGPGSTLKDGRFLLREPIGEGGMGIVYSAIDRRKTEARDPNPLVAIKILNGELARQPKALLLLQREARKAQTLAHPHIGTVFDFDRDGDVAFMSMELLHGRPLDAVLRDVAGQGLPREQALPILHGLAEGLAYAHRKGIVHSDLKPGNVFVTDDGVAKVLDFGIARAVPAGNLPAGFDAFDNRSLYACTEAYATAEMMQGAGPHPADDVYALGLIGYELLTGRHPYQRQGALKARELGLRPETPPGLSRRQWQTLRRSLSLDRTERPADAGTFREEFFGVRRSRKVLLALLAVTAVAAGYATWNDYRRSGPAVPFTALSVETQREFGSLLADGDRLAQFYRAEGNLLALQEAVELYARAYQLHPGNRAATAALERSADAALAATRDDPVLRRELATAFSERSEHLAQYPPLVAARAH